VEVLKGEIMPDFEVPKQEENKVHKKLNEFAAVIRNSSKFKEMSHEDGPEGPEAPPLSNHPAVKNHLSENQSQEPKAAPHISS
jgi:hypothetical protein